MRTKASGRRRAAARQPVAPGPGAPVYAVDPERFARGARTRSPAGDLTGLAEHLDHIASLGVGALALSPIFESAEGRAGDTIDYDRIATRLGGRRGFETLIAAARARGLGVMLDARFTHGSDRHPWFLEARRSVRSPHRDAFRFRGRKADLYRGQEGRPLWNLTDPAVARQLWDGPRSALFRWTRRGVTGWRLGGAVDLGPRLCAHVTDAVRALGGRGGVVGEVTGFARDWLDGGILDGVTNHVFRATAVALVRGEIPPAEAAWVLDRLATEYSREGLLRSWTVLGTEDAPRLATLLGEDAGRLRLAVTLQYAYPGVPLVHWGDEVGLIDGGGPGPVAMPWTEDRWNLELLEVHRRLGALRGRYPALGMGGYVSLHQPGEPEILAFARTDPDPRQTVVCIANPNARRTSVRLLLPLPELPDGLLMRDLLADRRVACREGFVRIELEQWDVALLVPEPLALPGHDFYAGALGA